ncbi:MAG TPA: hypothetical protein VI299_28385, partial [Polyangiales bacterium]
MIAFLLNLDAELELTDARHRTPAAIQARIAALRSRIAFLTSEDRVIGDDDIAGCTRAVAYCPTPRALARIREAGLPVPAAPPYEVLRSVNARAFCAALGQTLPGARYVCDMDALRATLDGGAWLLKRDFGFAGRERRQVQGGVLDAASEGFARRSFARGEGLQVEPWLAIELEVCQHGYITPGGQCLLAAPRLQHCDARGSWLTSVELPAETLHADEVTALAASTELACTKLREAGYFGPFVLDAFRYRDAAGTHFQPRSELNARLSMGYPRR